MADTADHDLTPPEKISALARLLEMPESELRKKLDSDRTFVYLKRQVEMDVVAEIEKAGGRAAAAMGDVSDPAVTRHLAAFLATAGGLRDGLKDGLKGGLKGDAVPDAILFNGGFFIPDILRQRVADVLEHWYGKRPLILDNRDLDLAVAVGALTSPRRAERGVAGAG